MLRCLKLNGPSMVISVNRKRIAPIILGQKRANRDLHLGFLFLVKSLFLKIRLKFWNF